MTDAKLPAAFNRLAWANLAAQAAEQLSLAATPIVAVTLLGAGPGETGLLATFQTLPFLLFSIPLGLLADRGSRLRLMVGAELLRAVSLLALLGALLTGQANLLWLLVMGFIGALGTVGFSVAAPALVPSLVPGSALARANGRLELARSLAYAGGPALAGSLVAWAGGSTAFVVAAVGSGLAVAWMRGLHEPRRTPAPPRHPWAELREGARQVWHQPLLRPIFQTAVIWNIGWFVLQGTYVSYAVRHLGLNAASVGLTLAGFGAGMVCGALLASRVLARLPLGRAVQFGPAMSLLACSTLAATVWWPSAALAGLGFFVFGCGAIIWTISSTTLRQTVTPGALLGRVSAIFLTGNAGARPLGAALGGLVGAHWGESACLGLAVLAFAWQLLLISGPAISRLQRLPPQEV